MFKFLVILAILGVPAFNIRKDPNVLLLIVAPIFAGSFLGSRILLSKFRRTLETQQNNGNQIATKPLMIIITNEKSELPLPKCYFPPLLKLRSERELTDLLFAYYLSDWKRELSDAVYRLLKALSNSFLPWNFQTIYSLLKAPEKIPVLFESKLPYEDKLFFEALSQRIIHVPEKFLMTLEKMSLRFSFLYYDHLPIIWVHDKFLVSVSGWTNNDKQFLSNFIEVETIELDDLLKILNKRLYIPNIRNCLTV